VDVIAFYIVPVFTIALGVFMLRRGFSTLSIQAKQTIGWLLVIAGCGDFLFRTLLVTGVIR
jgi:hypothetical protein